MQSSPTEIIETSDTLYAARARIESVRSIVELLDQLSSSNYEAAWRLGRALFFLGQETSDEKEAVKHHVRGISACRRAVKLKPERVEGHFWLGVNLALLAGMERRLRALYHALRSKRSLERAIRIDPAYHAAGPLRVVGRLQHRIPNALGGSKTRARESFERALELAPDNTVTRIYFAELLLDEGKSDEARKQLEAIFTVQPDPAWAFEAERDEKLAQEKLTKIDKMVSGKRSGDFPFLI